jgi:hypothetical protein
MPEICRFFGIIIRMFFDEHDPPHFHAEYQGSKAVFGFNGNVLKGTLNSKTATKLVKGVDRPSDRRSQRGLGPGKGRERSKENCSFGVR